ncbi:MAG: RES family NAD+ phosphorylase [Solirubrobacteraceae bacterium]
MILWRALPYRPNARPDEHGGALWFPRELQGAGRHDNPDLYGCFYASENPISPVAEALAPFRGTGTLTEAMLTRAGLPLALARLSLSDEGDVIDLDDPHALLERSLLPSQVATGSRPVTQQWAGRLFESHPAPVALRWWSTLEASLINLTLFDRAKPALGLLEVAQLTLTDAVVHEAADLLGLRA